MSDWHDIATAPKEKAGPIGSPQPVLLLYKYDKHVGVTVGYYNDDRYSKKPAPYWSTEKGYLFGKRWDREKAVLGWMPLPIPESPE